MFGKSILAVAITAAFVVPAPAIAADDAEIQKIREDVKMLDERLQKAETATPASAPAGPPASANAFNPAISLILGGQFNNLQQDPETYQIGGFIPGGDEIGPGNRSFNLGESELTVSANIDPYFSGFFVMAVTPENEVEVEEGYVQNTGFVPGATVKFGRFLSGFGYLNEIHAHAWDFVDAPLVYQAFFGGQLKEDGLQARWLAPTPVFLEFGLETGRGANFPGSERNKNGVNSGMIFAHVGDDVGISNSYRFGASYRVTHAQDRSYDDFDASGTTLVTNAFTGDRRCGGWIWSGSGRRTAIRWIATSSSRRSTCIGRRTAA